MALLHNIKKTVNQSITTGSTSYISSVHHRSFPAFLQESQPPFDHLPHKFYTQVRNWFCCSRHHSNKPPPDHLFSTHQCTGHCLFFQEPLETLSCLLHDKGLENVCCFGKKASISMFDIKEQYRSKGYGTMYVKKQKNIYVSVEPNVYMLILTTKMTNEH